MIRLTADDGNTTATYDVTVRYGNNAPTVNAGEDASVVSSASSAWTPSEIDTAAWYDATDASTVTELDGVVSAWNDKSGNGNDATQLTLANRPTIGGVGGVQIGGLDTISFRQANDQNLSVADNDSLKLDADGGANIFAVMRYGGYVNQGSGLNVAFSKGQILSTTSSYGVRVGSGDQLGFKAGNDLQPGTNTLTNQDLL